MRKIIANNIKIPIEYSERDALEHALKKMKVNGIICNNPVIYKKSLDARKKNDIHFVYSIIMETGCNKSVARIPDVHNFDETKPFVLDEKMVTCDKNKKILIVGSGPCGLFSAYVLAKFGFRPLLIERGSDVDVRNEKILHFWKTGEIDENTNIQFGEGGAGTFSDGKLNTRIGDPLQRTILEIFVENGAPSDILYQAKPHIGTDLLRECVRNIREKIIDSGGEVMFNTCLTDLIIKNGKISGAELNHNKQIDCDCIILALGHSSRDTYEMLERRGVAMEQKPFAAGVRIEHSREYINETQYGNAENTSILPTADYRLAYNGENRSCYSFCMCPGGVVVNASSEKDSLVVNGMSYHSRMERNSNSALVVSVRPEDFEGCSPLAGVEFQRKYERLAYASANGRGPVQLAKDFLRNKSSNKFDGVLPSFTGKTEFVDLRSCLPDFITETLKEGLLYFDNKMKGFSSCGSVLTGVEMRTSAPLRIKRDKDYESVNIKGLFPAGEGAGYAGGIMSAAIDGVRIAGRISGIL